MQNLACFSQNNDIDYRDQETVSRGVSLCEVGHRAGAGIKSNFKQSLFSQSKSISRENNRYSLDVVCRLRMKIELEQRPTSVGAMRRADRE